MRRLENQRKDLAKKRIKNLFDEQKLMGKRIKKDLFLLLDNALDADFIDYELLQMTWKCSKGLSCNPYELSQMIVELNEFIKNGENSKFDDSFRLFLEIDIEEIDFEYQEIYERFSLVAVRAKNFLEKHSQYENQQIMKDKVKKPNEKLVGFDVEQHNSIRQKVLVLLAITFGGFEIPDDVVKERVIETFHFLIEGDRQKIKTVLTNPTKTKENSERSIKSLCNDLHVVRRVLEKLGLSDAITKAISEIDCLIKEIEEKI